MFLLVASPCDGKASIGLKIVEGDLSWSEFRRSGRGLSSLRTPFTDLADIVTPFNGDHYCCIKYTISVHAKRCSQMNH